MRQPHPKTDASVRRIPVPEFAAVVIRRRLAMMGPGVVERTIFRNRSGGPLSTYNVRRTGATVIARSMGTDAAAGFLGHTSSVITEGHYIEPDESIDPTPASHRERTLRPVEPDGSLLTSHPADREDELLAVVDRERDDAANA